MKALLDAIYNTPLWIVWGSYYFVLGIGALTLVEWTLKGVLTIVGWFR